MEGKKILLYFSIKYNGDFDKIFKAIQEKEQIDEAIVDSTVASVRSSYTTLIDNDYPSILKNQYKPPFVLFYSGNLNILKNKPIIGIVGGSNTCSEITNTAISFASELAKDNNNTFIGLLGKGLNCNISKAIAKYSKKLILLTVGVKKLKEPLPLNCGLILSVNPNEATEGAIEQRNRLYGELAQKLLVVSGSNGAGGISQICASKLYIASDSIYVLKSSDKIYSLLSQQGIESIENIDQLKNKIKEE